MAAVGERVDVGGEDVVGRCAGRVTHVHAAPSPLHDDAARAGGRARTDEAIQSEHGDHSTLRLVRRLVPCAERSIELEGLAPILIICDRGLVGLVQHAVFEDQHVHLGAHEATVRILGRADDRLAPHVERRVDDDRAAGRLSERLEHMAGIDAARAFVAEGLRALRRGGVLFIVVPDYLKERAFFWDIDYTHNFVTTERRVRQLLYDGGLEIAATVRSIGAATGLRRNALAAGALLVNLPGVDAVSRWTRTEELLFRVRKNLFETLAFVARRPAA